MSLPPPTPTTMLGVGVLQVALVCGILQWLTRHSKTRLRWGRIAGLTLAFCLLSLPLVAVLVWSPPEDPVIRGRLGLAAIVVPVVVSHGVIVFRAFQEAHQRKAAGQLPSGRPGARPADVDP